MTTTKRNSIWSKLRQKVIAHMHVHCVLQTSRYPVDLLSLNSQSEHVKMDIQWFAIYQCRISGHITGYLVILLNILQLCYSPDSFTPHMFVEAGVNTDVWSSHHLFSKLFNFFDGSGCSPFETTEI